MMPKSLSFLLEQLNNNRKFPLINYLSGRKKRRGKKFRDETKPKKALTPYMLFIQEKRSEYCGTEKGQGRSFTEIMRDLAEMWKTLTPE